MQFLLEQQRLVSRLPNLVKPQLPATDHREALGEIIWSVRDRIDREIRFLPPNRLLVDSVLRLPNQKTEFHGLDIPDFRTFHVSSIGHFLPRRRLDGTDTTMSLRSLVFQGDNWGEVIEIDLPVHPQLLNSRHVMAAKARYDLEQLIKLAASIRRSHRIDSETFEDYQSYLDTSNRVGKLYEFDHRQKSAKIIR